MRTTAVAVAVAALLVATAPLTAAAQSQSAVAAPAPAPAPAAAHDAAAIINDLLGQLDGGQYDAARTRFNAEMATAVSAAQLKSVWESLPQHIGARTGRGTAEVAQRGGMQVATVRLRHQNGDAIAQVAVTADGHIAGFHIRPEPASATTAP